MADKDSNLIIGIDGDTKDFKKALQSLESVAKTALKGLTAGFATVSAGIAGAVMVGANFEQQMKNVQAISGATGAEFEALTAKAREMGIQTAFSATEAGQAFEYMAMAGWDTQAMLDGIAGIMDLAAASGEELALVSDIVTDALTAFGLQAKDSGHFADVLAMASSKSNTNIQMLGYSFKYVAPIAGALKFSVEDVAVALGLMANAGIKSEQAGTSLRALFTRLVKPPKEAAQAIERLGLAVRNADGTMRPLNDIIIDIRKGFANLSDAEKASVAGALAGQEAMSGLLAIVNASEEDFQKLTQSINNATGEAQRMADVKLDTLSGAWSNLGSTIEETGLIIYEELKKPFTDAIKDIQEIVSELNEQLKNEFSYKLRQLGKDISEAFKTVAKGIIDAIPIIINALTFLIDNFQIFAIAVLTFKGAQVFLTVAEAIRIAKNAMVALNAVMLANPITAVITAVTGLVAAFYYAYETNEKFRMAVQLSWLEIEYAIKKALNAIIEDLNKFATFINKALPEEWAIGTIKPFKLEDPKKEFNIWRKKLEREKTKAIAEQNKSQRELRENQKRIDELVKETEKLSEEAEKLNGGYKGNKNLLFPTVEVGTAKQKDKTQKNVFTDEFWAEIKKEAFEFETKAETELSQVAERVGRDFASSVRQAIQGEYETTEDAMRGIGANLIYSLADEMLAQTTNYLASALSQIGTFVISSMKGFFGIASPSKVFKNIGYENMRGLALGFSENQDIVNNATSTVADKVKAGLENINPTLTPSFNLQALKEMFNINAVTQPQLAGAVAGGNVTININSTFNMTGGSGAGTGQSITADDLHAFSRDIEKKFEAVAQKTIIKNMRAGGILSR